MAGETFHLPSIGLDRVARRLGRWVRWRAALASTERKTRSDAAVFAALDLIPRHLVLTSRVLAEQLGITPKSALATLHRLVDVGVLSEYGTLRRTGPGQPAGLFVSRELLGLAGSAPLR